jgi:nucleoid DNA-binding protein/cell division septation protein DedD
MTDFSFESIAWLESPKSDDVMPIDVSSHIEKLIFLHDTLVLPTFGAFIASRKSARVDAASCTMSPPTRLLSFNDAIVSDDGLLIADIAQTHHLSKSEAVEVVYEWIDQLQKRLNQREIVSLPGIGRMYKNYVQKVQFLPDSTNFNTDSFGLPPIQFAPLNQSREVSDHQSPAPTIRKTPPSKPRNRWMGALGIVLLLCAAGIGGFWWVKQQHLQIPDIFSQGENLEVLPPQTTSDESITLEEESTTTPIELPKQELKKEIPTPPSSTPEIKKSTNREPLVNTPPPAKGKTCILVVATLQEKENADRLKAQLLENGYDVYCTQKNGFQVGVQFAYKEIGEVQQQIFDLQKLTGERDIWIKQK